MPIHMLVHPDLTQLLEDVLPDQLDTIEIYLFPDPFRGEQHEKIHTEAKGSLYGNPHINNLRHESHCSRCTEPESHTF